MLYREATMQPRDHSVTFYDDDAELVACIADFVIEGVADGEWTIVVATAAHRKMLDSAFVRLGLDAGSAQAAGCLLVLDTDETIRSIMLDDRLDAERFAASAGDLLNTAEAKGVPVRLFGEMVATLWQQGNVSSAIELETWWNELARARQFSLLCAYAVDMVGASPLDDLDQVCELHATLTPPLSYRCADAGTSDPLGDEVRTAKTFVCVPAAIPAVRRFVAKVLRGWGEDEAIPDAVLVASELATNALRHARSPFRVSLDRSGATVRVGVEDLGLSEPALCRPTDDATWGRGVFIVDDVCSDWGTDPLPHGKLVWADLRTPS